MVFQHFLLADNLTRPRERRRSAPRSCTASATTPARRSRRSPTPTASASTPTSWSRRSASASASASRSSRCSTAARRSSSSTSRPPCSCRRRSTRSSRTSASSRTEGHTLIFISHKLDEVLAVADDITVMRRGTTVATVKPGRGHRAQAGRADGRQRAALARAPRSRRSPTGCCSRSSDLDAAATRRARRCCATSASTIHAGEVLGIAGVEGNGQSELVEAVIGMRQATAGRVRLGRAGHHRLVDPRAPRGRHRLHPRGPSPARPAARLPAVGEPHPRPPDPAAVGQGPWLNRRGARADSAAHRRRRTTSAPRASTPPRGRCPAATSRSSSWAAR